MNLFKRQASRVAAVGVVVGLLVLGLEAPAFAAPAITAISPDSGPVGCVVDITGTGFDQPGAFAVATVKFTGATINSVNAIFHVVSDTEIWTTVPATAASGAITVSDGNGATANSPVFTIPASGPGNCAPTIDSFDPTCGVVGTPVTITGTNLLTSSGNDLAANGPVADPVGAAVKFNPYASNATHTGAAESPTTLVVSVPGTALDGPIRVNAAGPAVDSTDSFNVVTDAAECGVTGATHGRAITLSLKKHLVAKGMVSLTDATDTTTECIAGVPVKIQKRKSGHWKTVGKTTTKDNGAYKKRIKDKPGRYRAKAPKVTLTTGDVCSGAKSRTVKHK
jgi:hypothetical protein